MKQLFFLSSFLSLLFQSAELVHAQATLKDLDSVFSQVISVALSAVGLTVLVMFIVGGYQFLSAGGDKDAAARARGTLTYAVIGLALAVSAWIIVSLLGSFLGINFSTFSVCFDNNCGY